MSISFDKFVSWAESRFGDVIIQDNEVKLNSIFTEDYKHHLWCNPSGGINERENGVFHCWKTDKNGTLTTLVMLVDKCGYEEALSKLGGSDFELQNIEEQLEELFYKPKPREALNGVVVKNLELPPSSYLISDLKPGNYHRMAAETYLSQRQISINNLYICTGGDYRNRIVIPYYDNQKNLIYFNARYFGSNKNVPKYYGPSKTSGVGKGDVVYMPVWPEIGSRINFCEGEFNALSIVRAGLLAGAFGGKNMTDKQANLIAKYKITLAFDNDSAGRAATYRTAKLLESKGVSDIRFVPPPNSVNDWNEFLVKYGPTILREYLRIQAKPFDEIQFSV